jgi:hypothetical protein
MAETKAMLTQLKIKSRDVITLGTALIACASLTSCRTAPLEPHETIIRKLPPLREFTAATPGPFEQQFRIDTGETNLTRRSEFEQTRKLRGQSKERLLLRIDLSDWPEPLRSPARLWIGIGAPNSFTTEVTINLTFTQNGAGISTGLNNSINIDGVALMGCNFAVSDGDVTIDLENLGLSRDVDYTLHVIVYVPGKADPH